MFQIRKRKAAEEGKNETTGVKGARKKQVWLIDGRPAFVSIDRTPKAFSPGKEKVGVQPPSGVYVTGSGLVHVPPDRVNEIPKVIQEHHDREARRTKWLAYARRA